MNKENNETKMKKIQAVATQIFNITFWLFWIIFSIWAISEEELPLWAGIPLLIGSVVGFVSKISYLTKKTSTFLAVETISYLVLAIIFVISFFECLQNGADLTGAFGILALYSILEAVIGFLKLRTMKKRNLS